VLLARMASALKIKCPTLMVHDELTMVKLERKLKRMCRVSMTTVISNHRHTDKTVEGSLHIFAMKPKGNGLDLPHVNLMTFRVD